MKEEIKNADPIPFFEEKIRTAKAFDKSTKIEVVTDNFKMIKITEEPNRKD